MKIYQISDFKKSKLKNPDLKRKVKSLKFPDLNKKVKIIQIPDFIKVKINKVPDIKNS